MDPNATLRYIHDFITDYRVGDEVDEACQNLYDWIQKGGFEPDWQHYPIGASYYDCRVVAMRKGEA